MKTIIETLPCTLFRGIRNTSPLQVLDLLAVLNEIRSDRYRSTIEQIRSEAMPSKSKLKEALPGFTPTGTFSHRSTQGLVEYNGCVCLDIDRVESAESLKSVCKNLHWVFAAFVTPSGQGLKVLVKTNSSLASYKQTEERVAEAFKCATGYERDSHCKDIARIQFVSYDPLAYINVNAITF
jgi:hypothetical protein